MAFAFGKLGFLSLLFWCSRLYGQAPQTLSWDFPDVSKLPIGKPIPISVQASSGLPVSLQVARGSAVIAGDTITATRVGTIRVTASQVGNAEFLPVSISRVFNRTELRASLVKTLDLAGKVRVHDNLLFIAGAALEIYGLTDPSNPTLRARLQVDEPISDLAVAGQYVLVTTGNFLRILDISRPELPAWVGSLTLDDFGGVLSVEGSLVAIGMHRQGIGLVEWSDPRNPRWLHKAHLSSSAAVSEILLRDGQVYVSGPDLPLTRYSLPLPDSDPLGDGSYLWDPTSLLDSDGQTLVMAGENYIGFLDFIRLGTPSLIYLPFPIRSESIRFREGWVHLAGSSSAVWAIEAGDEPGSWAFPQLLLGEAAQSVDRDSDYVFTGSNGGAVNILKVREGLTQDFIGTAPGEVWVTNGPVTLELLFVGPKGNAATLHLDSGPAVLSGNQLTITNAGLIRVSMDLPGDNQFFEAHQEWLVVARKLGQSIVFSPPPFVGLAGGPMALQAISSSGLPVTLEVVSGPATLEGRNLIPKAVGAVVVRAIQEGSLAYLPAEPVQTTIQIVDLPEIVHQPNPTNVPSGSPVALNVVVRANSTPRFQWYRDGTPLSGETEPELRRASVGPVEMGLHHVVVSLDSGGSVTSSVVSLTVDLPGSEVRLRPRGSLRHRSFPSDSNPGRIEVQGHYAYVVNQALNALQVHDVGNPDAPLLVSTVPLLSSLHQDLAHKDGYLLLAERERGIGILDLADPGKPTRLPSYRFPGNQADVVTIQVIGNQAFVGNGSYGLAVLDVSNPRQPALISSFDTSGLVAGVWIQGDLAYLADWGSGFKVLNLANVAVPRQIGRYPDREQYLNYYDLVSRNGWVYLVHQDIGLVTFDLSQPFAPAVTQTNRGSIIGVDLAGRTLFAADNLAQRSAPRTPGVRLFDLQNPSSPADLGRFADWGRMDGVRLEGNRLYVTGDRFGIIDIEFPQRPPSFVAEPQSVPLLPGDPGRLSCVVEGSDPLSYQWWFRGAPLPDGTNRSLTIGPVTDENAGLYTVEVRNPWGTIRSTPARIGFAQQIRWDALSTNSVLRIQRPHELPMNSDQGLPLSYRVLSGPAMLTQGQLLITNVGTVRLIAEQPGSESIFPASREWVLNLGSVRFVERGRWPEFHPGQVVTMDLEGDLAVVAIHGGGLLALDVSNPARPRFLGEFSMGGLWTGVKVSKGIAYAMNTEAGLAIVDFRNPALPVLLSTYRSSAIDGFIRLVPPVAFINSASGSFEMVDVSNPAAPVPLQEPEGIWGYDRLEIEDDWAIGTHPGTGIQVLDLRDPYRPLRVSVLFDLWLRVKALSLQDNHVALLSSDDGLELLNVSEDGVLEPRARIGLPSPASGLAWLGQQLWVILDSGGFLQVDASNLQQPRLLQQTEFPFLSSPTSIHFHGEHVYVADSIRGIVIYEIRSGGEPVEVGWFPTLGLANAVEVEGKRAYVNGLGQGLAIIDISDPNHPVRLGGMASRNRQYLFTDALAVSGTRVFYADGSAGIQMVNVEDPESPTRVGSLEYISSGRIQAPRESELHLGNLSVGTLVFDVTDPSQPVQVSASSTKLNDFWVSDRRRIGIGGGKLWVEDLTVTGTAITVGSVSLDLGQDPRMALSGDRVFIGADMSPLIVVDVSNPQRPFTRQQIPKVGPIRSLQVEGDYLFVAGPSAGLAAYHAFLPDGLKLASQRPGFFGTQDIEVVGDRIYVVGGSGGLTVVEYQVGIEQTVPNLPTNSRTAIGTMFDLPAISDAGLPVRYTVVEGNALIEGGKLRLSHEGYVTIRADVEGDLQFFPASAELEFVVLRTPTLVMEPTADGPKLRWKLGFGEDFLEVSESIHGPWQWAPIESQEFLEGDQIRVSTGSTSPSPLFYRVSRR